MEPVTAVAVSVVAALAGIGATTLYFAAVLIVLQIAENRAKKSAAERLTQGGTVKK
jgi:hypothetical protein